MVWDDETERRCVNQWISLWLFRLKEIMEPMKGYDLCPLSVVVAVVAAEEVDIIKILSNENK